MTTRRQFLTRTGAAGLVLATAATAGVRTAQAHDRAAPRPKLQRRRAAARRMVYGRDAIPGGTLDPITIQKYQEPLIIPPAMPMTGTLQGPSGQAIDYYEIAVRQFTQQILPPGLPETTVWSYGSINHPGTFNYPAFTIEAQQDRPVRVKWINGLVDENGNYLPHLLPVDQTLHWANPPGPRDGHGMSQAPYQGPVPIVTHVHGAHTYDESDGYAEAWYLPAARNIPPGYARVGSWYRFFGAQFAGKYRDRWEPGTATFQYPNSQRPTTIWYHDHTLGMTRLNVYAGPAGFYLLRGGPGEMPDGVLPGPAPQLGEEPGTRHYEIPIAIQDRSFNQDGSLFYPDNRAFFEGLEKEQLRIPFHPDQACGGESDVAPIWNPEFFGNTMVVNGRTWPYLEVEQRRYRFRLLNGCNSRFLILKLSQDNLPFWVIGSDGGYLPAPVSQEQLLMSPAERYDVIVDFTDLPVGTEVLMLNLGPDEPFGGGMPGVDFPMADPGTTGEVMQFRVVARNGEDTSTLPAELTLPAYVPLGPADNTRLVSLNELDSHTVRIDVEADGDVVLDCDSSEFFGPVEATLGVLSPDGSGLPLDWNDQITENPALNATEIWEMYNFTMDAHPIHIHEIMFEVVNREVFDPSHGGTQGEVTGPEPVEQGRKDTVIAYPGQITRVKAHFDLPGLYVWHCHIVEHEDNEMMRPYIIGSRPDFRRPWHTQFPLISK